MRFSGTRGHKTSTTKAQEKHKQHHKATASISIQGLCLTKCSSLDRKGRSYFSMPLLRRGPLHAFRALDAFRAEPVKRFRLKKKVKVDTCNSRRWRSGSLATPGTASKPEEKPSQSRRRTKQILPLLDWRHVSLPEDLISRSYLETFISHIFKHMGSELKSHVAMTCACMVGCNPLGNSGEFRIGAVRSGSEMYMTALPFIVNQLRVAC